jgi:hypothetical protein
VRSLRTSTVVFLVAICVGACGIFSRGRTRLDFAQLLATDRIEVVTNVRKPVKTIREEGEIRTAITFIQNHQDGWSEHYAGPRVPSLQFEFYAGERYLGGFGVAHDYAVSDPSTAGFLSRDVPQRQIDDLLNQLGLARPEQ